MAKRLKQFTQEEIEILLQNPNVEDATTNTVKYTSEFKKLALQKTDEGISPNEIFIEAGFDLKIIGKHTTDKDSGKLVKIRKKLHLNIFVV